MGFKKFKKKLKNCFGRQMPLEVIGVSNATQGYWGIKCHLWLLGRQMPPVVIVGVKCHPRFLGHQMPPRGYWDVKGLGESKHTVILEYFNIK